jgi:hypothetical protein
VLRREPADVTPPEGETADPKELERLRDRALALPSWAEWFYASFLKVYGALGLFVGDAILAAYWLEIPNALGLLATLLPVVYLEFLLFQYLWHEPDPSGATRSAGPFRPTWLRPVRFGRWSSMGQRVRRGRAPFPGEGSGPDPHEFL